MKLFLTVPIVVIALTCHAQNHLMRDITIGDSGRQRIGDLLESVSQNQGFYFAYNSNTVNVDSLVDLSSYHGPLIGFLERTFGRDYEFKDSPGYVIIRYAPGTMELTLQVEKERGKPLMVEGQVKDARNGKGIYLASIYERNILVSTLSGPTGNFRLTIKRPEETIWLTVSKENYRDTTIALLPPVQVGKKAERRRYWFYPDDGYGGGLESTAFGRFFTSTRQRIQRINLGGFFAYSPYQVSLTPGLSSQGLFNSQVVNQFSLNIIGGHTAGVNGAEVGGVFNIDQQDVRHFQVAGLFNLVGGSMHGVQLAGASNVVVQRVSGIQVAGVNNRSGRVTGVQLAGLFNVAEDIHGAQVTGVVNVAGKVNGIQLASVMNIADSSDYPIGLINLVKKGRKSLAATLDESGMAQLAFRSGGQVLYGLIGVGHYLNGNPARYALEAGLGVHALRTGPFGLDAEAVSRVSTDFGKHSRHRLSLRLLPQLGLGTHWGIAAGPTLYLAYPGGGDGSPRTLGTGIYGGVLYRW